MKKTMSALLSFLILISVTVGMPITSLASNIQPITFGTEVSGECDYNEHSYYQFDVPVSGKVTFDLKGTNYRSGGKDGVAIQIFESPYNMQDYNYNYRVVAYYSDAFGYAANKEEITLKAGTYYIRTDAWCSGGNAYDYYDYSLILTYKATVYAPSTFKVSTRNNTSLKLSWSKVSGASGYQLQQLSGDTYKTKATTSSTSATVSNLLAGKNYKFRVRAYKTVNGKKYYSSWKYLLTCTKPKTVTLSSLTTYSTHKIKASWKKVGGYASGYQIYWAKDKNFKNVVAKTTVSGQNTLSYTGKGFTKGKKYYVKVRAYKTVNGTKYYGSWSNVKSITCK
ncbi:MAG: fibronectin type III domain-containing protein [Eubacterium sp.]